MPLTTGMTCTIQVGFKPTNVGTRAAVLNIAGTGLNGTRHVALTGTGTAPPSGVTWNTLTYATPAYSWNYGASLGRTVVSGSQRLHLAYNTDRIGSSWASDTGPYVGAYYVKSTTGATWTAPFRLNSSTTHAINVGLAASGTHVYAVWETATKWVQFSPTAPRILYVRVNTNHGASTAWKTAVRLSSTTGRASFPTIAAAGNDVYIAWTNAVSGAIELTISHDAGTTWKTIAVGTTTQSSSQGYSGDPSVAASGSTVAVVWTQNTAGAVGAQISTDKGAHWTGTTTLGTSIGVGSVAVRGARIAVTWPTADDVVLRQRISGVWSAPMIVAHLQTGAPTLPYSTTVVLQDPNRVGVAWAEALSDTTGQLRWAESANGGGLWYQAQTIAGPISTRQINDWPSVLWPAASTRQVVWSGWTNNTNYYREYIRIGTGAPTGPTTLAVPYTGGVSTSGVGPDAGARLDRSRLERGNLPRRD
jgi:hypothetical protein